MKIGKIKKITFKILPILLCILFIIMPFTNIVLAETEDFSFGGILKSVREFIAKGKSESGTDEISGKFIEQTAPLFSAIYFIGLAVAVGVLIIIGIQYATSSPDQKAELKGKLIGFAVAVVILTAAIPIWSLVVNTFSSTTGIEV